MSAPLWGRPCLQPSSSASSSPYPCARSAAVPSSHCLQLPLASLSQALCSCFMQKPSLHDGSPPSPPLFPRLVLQLVGGLGDLPNSYLSWVRLCVWSGAHQACGRHLEHCSLLASRACTAPPNFARTRGLVSVSELQWLRDRNVLSCLYAAQDTVLEACPALPS